MKAMQLLRWREPLHLKELPIPVPMDDQVQIKVSACGICRTDLHVVDGELTQPNLPIIPGHQIVGHITACGDKVQGFKVGDRVGVPWLGYSCQHCQFCLSKRENLCDMAEYTGYQINGGMAEYCVANADYCFKLPDDYDDYQVAPLLCAGLIGYRAYQKVKHVKHLGIFGFGSAAHLITQVAKFEDKIVYAFTKDNDAATQAFAKKCGVDWAGGVSQEPAKRLEGAIIFASAGELVPRALSLTQKGGIVVCAGIHMSNIPTFPYSLLWGERVVTSIANLTRHDGEAFLEIAPKVPIHSEITLFPLEKANEALEALRLGKFKGSAVIKI